MKIVYIEGITHIQLEHVDELPSAMAILPQMGQQRVEIIMPTNGHTAAPIPSAPAQTPIPVEMPVTMPLPGMPTPVKAKKRKPMSGPRKYPVANIGPIHATPHAIEVLELLRAHPEGLSTRQMIELRHAAELAAITDPAAREAEMVRLINNFSTHASHASTMFGLSRRLPQSLIWVLSEFGKIAMVAPASKPSTRNRFNKRLFSYVSGLVAGEYE